ncbi:branched-chain amino acid ABC transporter permease [Nocardioides daejeonensis]|uniref:branched-chain amino acid ABC transporter permease n=1 Tax=Nocardioides daejeonensis TaxID=1046556 RepID=UPI000D743B8B|nr:branched-chain amino acid ABC transporter permease [Nocardioides daejeonensis]
MDFSSLFSDSLQQAFGTSAIVYCLAAIGLNIHFGYTGLLNFGQAAFMAVGGYTMAMFVTQWDVSLWLAMLAGLGLTAVLAILLGIPTLRLRADYLAIVTIAAAEIVRQVYGSIALKKYFGAQDGLTAFSADFRALNPFDGPVDLGIVSWGKNDAWVVLVGWFVVALCCLVVWLLMRSPWGRILKSIREDEDAVRSLGKNVYYYKMQSLMLGGMIGALAGFVTALKSAAINPSFFATDVTFFAYTVLLIGGAARVLGPVVGAIIFWFLLTFLDLFFSAATDDVGSVLIPSSIMTNQQASLVRFIVMGLALMLLMIFRPQGIFGDRRELAIDGR